MIKIIMALISLGLISDLRAVDMKMEFYKADNIPAEYKKLSYGFDCTVIILDGLPSNRNISVFQGRRECEDYDMKKLGMLPLNNGKGFLVTSAIGYLPGELVKLELKDDKRTYKEIFIVPCPIYAKSLHDNAIIKAIIQEKSPVMYSIAFEGFKENEKILFKSFSYNECVESDFVINKNFSMMTMPAVINKKGGIAKINIIRSSGEVLEIELPWGLEWMKYAYYLDNGKVVNFFDDAKTREEFPEIDEYFKSQQV
jgi:hypothetical protein